MSEAKKLRDLLLKASKDREFRMKLLNNPEEIAKEYSVKLKAAQIKKMKETAEFVDSLNELELPIDEILYPVERLVNQWKWEAVVRLSAQAVRDWRKPIFYPAPGDVGLIDYYSSGVYPAPPFVRRYRPDMYPVPFKYRRYMQKRYE